MRAHGFVHLILRLEDATESVDFFLQLGLFLLVEAVLARLLPLNLPLQVLNLQVLLDLRLILLLLQLCLLASVLVLVARKLILQLLVLVGPILNIRSDLALFFLKSLEALGLFVRFFDHSREVGEKVGALHLINCFICRFDQICLLFARLFLVALDCRLLLQLPAQLRCAVLQFLCYSLSNKSS